MPVVMYQGACTKRASQNADEVCSMPHGMSQEKPPSLVYLSAPSQAWKPSDPAYPAYSVQFIIRKDHYGTC